MNFVFVTQKSWSEAESDLFDTGDGRRLTCKGQNKLQKCCGANAFQGLLTSKRRKERIGVGRRVAAEVNAQ
jgi:hypothetical protein